VGSGQWAVSGSEPDDLAHQAAANAGVAAIAEVGQLRGESRFAIQGNKFTVHEGSTKIGCHFWHHPTRPMQAEEFDQLPDRSGFDPAEESG
jgi:RNA polymerase sigma-70 factor (ECF subfamily)